MKELIAGILDFRKRIRPELQNVFQILAKRQNPNSIFVACSDSRVVPNLFASTNPGELFVVRNVGNLIPLCKDHNPEFIESFRSVDSVGAAVEFSVLELGVRNVIVCGHSSCGAMQSLLSDRTTIASRMPHVHQWLKNGNVSLEKMMCHVKTKEIPQFLTASGTTLSCKINSQFPLVDQLSQVNVLQQLEHLISYKLIRERVSNKEILLHAWWFDIGKADVYSFSEKREEWVLIDEEKANQLLDKIIQFEKLKNVYQSQPDVSSSSRSPSESSSNLNDPYWLAGLKK